MVPGYKTLDVLYTEQDVAGKIPVEVHVEKQQRVRDDESVTRPFIKLRLVIGNRVVYCDIRQAEALSRLIDRIAPSAQDALEELLSSSDRSYKPFKEAPVTSDGTPVENRRVRRKVRKYQEYDNNH